MSFLSWVAIGLFVSFIANMLLHKKFVFLGREYAVDAVIGVSAAVLTGWLFSTYDMTTTTGVTLFGLVVPIIGAALALITYHSMAKHLPTS
ncbi:GlsB/YeaQ/YmgE family stress response membrane protein [Chitinolyticbacter albus]|uniref:GlsB/YeaQ/YmgE family stress response membrane protein n=1 Tax=Chitinolyticbacter albus TaxID=2961951 RepID=UPI00210D7DDA|nr:hypothetical protein [Chitinolyticbacter albus]